MEMERRHPKLYTGVCRQMGLAVVSEKSIAKALSAMALEMFKERGYKPNADLPEESINQPINRVIIKI